MFFQMYHIILEKLSMAKPLRMLLTLHYLLEKAHVATVTGEAFGCPNNIRISYTASMNDIEEAVRRIQQALS